MKILITGSRHFNDYEQFSEVLSGLPISELIHGGANGADSLGERYARENNIPSRTFPALWDKYGRRAGYIRNWQMLREGTPDYCVAFLASDSRGTRDMINAAKEAGLEVEIINI